MVSFLARRLTQGLLVLLGVTIIVFVATRLVGDPIRLMLPLDASEEQRTALRSILGLDQPLVSQFPAFAGNLLRGDFGESTWQDRPSLSVVIDYLPNTFALTGAAATIVVLFSVPLGTMAASRPNSRADRIATTGSLFGLSAPVFWVGLLLIIVFGVRLGWLPTSGVGSWKHLVLPAVTLSLPSVGRLSMFLRSHMIDELNRPWIVVAELKGVSKRAVKYRHALRNAAVPYLTLAGWDIAKMLSGGALIVEVVFAWPGIGYLALQSIQRGDLFLLQAIVFVVAGITVVVNMAVDIAHSYLDPRVRLS